MGATQQGTAAGRLPVAFWRLWAASTLSNTADGVLKLALPLVAVQTTRSPALVAGLAVALSLPWLVVSLPVGALVDRWDRRRAVLGAQALRVLVLGALTAAVLVDGGSIAALYVAAFALGVAETLYDTAAQSLVPQLVPPGQLSRANGRLFAAEMTAGQFLGPPLAGVLAAAGAAAAFGTTAGLWVLAGLALVTLRGDFRTGDGRRAGMRAEIAEGLGFSWRQPLLRTIAVLVGVTNLALNATFAVLVLYAVGPGSAMGLTGSGLGLLLAVAAAGSVAGSFLAGPLERRIGRAWCIRLGLGTGALFMAAPAASAHPVVVGAGFLVGGAGLVVSNVMTMSLRQRITPARLLGRVNSGFRLVSWGALPLGAAAGGLLASAVGLRATFAGAAALSLAVLVLTRWTTDERMDAAEAAVAAAREPDPAG
ncbi:MFS transporter [Modestobacter sp. I12A-02628]|uniref:MFS transporter n=1 Tax=Goekera deserti TaxID=2497753 RepID=A0A7K3WG58_9ACTN|nr:MFS transporter [Goekera deserti]MPQ96577.1 MFS transporter [Goekera deserti]NDI47111.1 MFS transporter [Goekera deserti]NEL55491.1 MFS transporter [Goekera deserti]